MNNADVFTIDEIFKDVEVTFNQVVPKPLELENALRSPSDLIKYCLYMARHLHTMVSADPEIIGPYCEKYLQTAIHFIDRFQDSTNVPGEQLESSVFARLEETKELLHPTPFYLPLKLKQEASV
jgi:hypothetical protein